MPNGQLAQRVGTLEEYMKEPSFIERPPSGVVNVAR